MGNIKIILASNRELWWDGLYLLIRDRSKDIDVVAVCYKATDLINRAAQLKPDIVLIDEEIEGGDCGEVAQRINELHPKIDIIIVMKPYRDIRMSTSFQARAKAYIDKDITYSALESCIYHVAKGGFFVLSPEVAQGILDQVANFKGAADKKPKYDAGLSKREEEVLTLLAQKGISNKGIAEALHITENTVKAHLSSILEKMHVHNRQQAAILARERGIVADLREIKS